MRGGGFCCGPSLCDKLVTAMRVLLRDDWSPKNDDPIFKCSALVFRELGRGVSPMVSLPGPLKASSLLFSCLFGPSVGVARPELIGEVGSGVLLEVAVGVRSSIVWGAVDRGVNIVEGISWCGDSLYSRFALSEKKVE